MIEVKLWWRMPGERQVKRLNPNSKGETVFHFAPFVNDEAHPHIEFRGHAVDAEFPNPGELELPVPREVAWHSTTRKGHLLAIENGLKAIDEQALEKVVLSRIHVVPRGAEGPESAFAAKCAEFPDAFVYLMQHPATGTWTGASPELLLKRRGDQFETVALAGTRRMDSRTEWTQKERNEQAVVTTYIEQALTKLGIDGVQVGEVHDRAYGAIAHLESTIQFQSNRPLSELARTLHPTPAVGGAPLQSALDFIQLHESQSRGYYAGFLGLESPAGGDLFVNLRCIEWLADGLVVHAGGGIVKGSDPASEWEETEAKIASILSGLER